MIIQIIINWTDDDGNGHEQVYSDDLDAIEEAISLLEQLKEQYEEEEQKND